MTQQTPDQGTGQSKDQGTEHQGVTADGQPTSDPTQDATKDPSTWVTGDEPMTGPQKSYLQTLAREAGEEVPDGVNKAQASEEIDRLQQETGRGA